MPVSRQIKKRKMRPKMSVRKNDTVELIAGKDRGKRGTITRVIPDKNRVVVEGLNMVKRHLRRQPGSLQAGIVDMPAPLSRSNVMLVCPACDEPTRIGNTRLPNGDHLRICKKCGEIIDKEQ